MALTYTIAGLQGVLDSVETAISAADYETAWKHYARYALNYAGLVRQASADGETYQLVSPEQIKGAIQIAEAAAGRSADQGRFIRTQTRFPS